MSYAIIKDGERNEFDDEQQFHETKDLLEQNGVEFDTEEPENTEMSVPDGGNSMDVEVVDHTENGHEEDDIDAENDTDAMDTTDAQHTQEIDDTVNAEQSDAMQIARNNLADPLDTLPGWMKSEVSYSDRGDSSTTINKRGCEVIANYLDLEPDFEVITSAEESDFEHCYYRCVMTAPDGKTYEGYGTARADGNDQGEDAGWKIEMMAQTRAFKRAVKFATGDGIEAFVEAQQ